MPKYASAMVELAQSLVGIKEGSAGHQEILDIYNSQPKLPRGFKMPMNQPWCAAFTTALAVKLGYTDIVPCECSCSRLIAIAKEMGIWIEDESITPKPGMLCLYDWDEKSNKGDNKGAPEHIGIVETEGGGKFVVIEGNADINRDGKDGVERRPMEVNGKNLRGFIAPKYDPEPTEEVKPKEEVPEPYDYQLGMYYLRRGDEGAAVEALQILLIGRGYGCGRWGADGEFGSATEGAVKAAQHDAGIEEDGVAGPDTFSYLLGLMEGSA